MFQSLRDTLKALPVHSVIGDVVKDVLESKVTVLAAPTGSGKSMLLPSALADAGDDQVVVLVPRRFLATDAACNVAELSGAELGEEVGFALGQVNGERSMHGPDTKLLFCTYGYALRSGLINKARTIVLDEVHEGDEHISLARAVLHQRKRKDPGLRILEMSATVNAEAQAAFWKDIAPTSVHHAESLKPACDLIHESPMLAGNNGRTIEQVVVDLLENGAGDRRWHASADPATDNEAEDYAKMLEQFGNVSGKGCNGIAVFRGGVKEVETTVANLQRLLQSSGIRHVEVVGIHGSTPSDERRAARLPPKKGWRKIIVGTNVIESGVNLLWVDAGVSDGVRKVPHHRADTGAETLVEEDLPQSGIIQQMGRVNRNSAMTGFDKGIFILHAKNNFEQRRRQNGPAIEHESIMAPAFHAASLGYDPTRLKWDVSPQHVSALPARLERAQEELARLELVHGDWSLTHEGEFIRNLPVSPEMGAMLNEARHIDEQHLRAGKPSRALRDTVIIAAIAESRSLKVSSKDNHHGDQHGTSDLLDALNAYRAIVIHANKRGILKPVLDKTSESFLATASQPELQELHGQRDVLAEQYEKYNMSLNGFLQVTQLVAEIGARLNAKGGITLQPITADETYDAARYNELKRCILNGSSNKLFQFEHDGLRDLLRDHGHQQRENGQPFSGYELAESSIISKRMSEGALVTGQLREVKPKRKPSATRDEPQTRGKKKNGGENGRDTLLVVSNATVIPPEVFVSWVKGKAERSPMGDMSQDIIVDSHLSPDGRLHANYAGKARFEVPLPPAIRAEAKGMLGLEEQHGHNGHSKKHKKKGGKQAWANRLAEAADTRGRQVE